MLFTRSYFFVVGLPYLCKLSHQRSHHHLFLMDTPSSYIQNDIVTQK